MFAQARDNAVTDGISFDAGSVDKGTRGNDDLKGHGTDDRIGGRGGNDILHGAGGDDTVSGGSGADFVRGGEGRDHVRGDSGDDKVGGGAGRDHLNGGAGDDILRGGAGVDHLTGGAGADQFVVAGDGKMDIVTDFNALEGDLVNAVGFKLLGLSVDLGLGVTTATFDRDNDGIADASIRVNGVLDLSSIILGKHGSHAVAPDHAFAADRIHEPNDFAIVNAHLHELHPDTAHLAIA